MGSMLCAILRLLSWRVYSAGQGDIQSTSTPVMVGPGRG